jgi:hypothetical protein
MESLSTNTNVSYFSNSSLVAPASSLSSSVSANTTVAQMETTILSSVTQSSTTASLPGTTVANTTEASTIAVTMTPQQTVIATNNSPASTGSPAVFGYLSAKSISDAITNFANKFAIIGVAALVLGLGCAFVVYRRVNSEGEVEV